MLSLYTILIIALLQVLQLDICTLKHALEAQYYDTTGSVTFVSKYPLINTETRKHG
jgi:hypothetical protein